MDKTAQHKKGQENQLTAIRARDDVTMAAVPGEASTPTTMNWTAEPPTQSTSRPVIHLIPTTWDVSLMPGLATQAPNTPYGAAAPHAGFVMPADQVPQAHAQANQGRGAWQRSGTRVRLGSNATQHRRRAGELNIARVPRPVATAATAQIPGILDELPEPGIGPDPHGLAAPIARAALHAAAAAAASVPAAAGDRDGPYYMVDLHLEIHFFASFRSCTSCSTT